MILCRLPGVSLRGVVFAFLTGVATLFRGDLSKQRFLRACWTLQGGLYLTWFNKLKAISVQIWECMANFNFYCNFKTVSLQCFSFYIWFIKKSLNRLNSSKIQNDIHKVSSGIPHNGIPAEFYVIFQFCLKWVTKFSKIPRNSVKYGIPRNKNSAGIFFSALQITRPLRRHL